MLKEYIVTSFKSLLNNSPPPPSLPIVMPLASFILYYELKMDKQQITGYIVVSVDGGDALLLRRLVSRNKSNSSRAKFYVYTGGCPPT